MTSTMKKAFREGRLVMTAKQQQPSGVTGELECDMVVRESAMLDAFPIRLSMELSDVPEEWHGPCSRWDQA